ncbi:MAG: AAA family ATPase [Oceanicaulis sp.]|nr:AAA family ATPase [Salinarimonas sp.]MCH8490383.1 AAA family ATPase [Oceanicaulis sp.]
MTNDNHNPNADVDHHDAEPTASVGSADAASNVEFDPHNVEHVLQAASDHCFPDDDDDEAAEAAAATPPKSSRGHLVQWVIRHRLAGQMKPIVARKPHCLLIEVPDRSWCVPLAAAIRGQVAKRTVFDRNSDLTLTPDDGPSRKRDVYLRDKATEALSRGDPLVFVFDNANANIPNDVLAMVDNHVTLTPLSSTEVIVIVEEITQCCLPATSDDIASGLTFDQICSAVRLGDTGGAIVQRLRGMRQNANRTRSINVPSLDELTGYGDAKTWGLRLSREVERYRRGEIRAEELPRGLLLSGPPGCGKTMFAQSLARTCSIPIVPTSVAAWFQAGDGHLGDVVNAVKQVFDEAHKLQKPAILFLDECDAFVDPNRQRDTSQWWNTMRAAVLSEIDGASTEPGLILIGACNYPDLVDPALKRSGRLDKHIRIALPDADALATMLRTAFASEMPNLDFLRFGRRLVGSTGADVARLVREIRAHARDHDREVCENDIDAVIVSRDRIWPEHLRRIAIHEAGHAIVSSLLGRRVTSLGLGNGETEIGGYATASRPRYFTKTSLEDEVTIALAGRAAEEAFGIGASSGASADLACATDLLTRAHTVYGFGRTLRGAGDEADTARLLAETPQLDQLIDADLDRLWQRTKTFVADNTEQIGRLAEALIEQRHLDHSDIQRIMVIDRDHDRNRLKIAE